MLKVSSGLVGAAVAAGLLFSVSTVSAQADTMGASACRITAYHNDDWARGDNCAYLGTITVTDEEADGNGVRAEYFIAGSGTMRTLRDSNGSAGSGAYASYTKVVTKFRVCESSKGCSAWHYLSGP